MKTLLKLGLVAGIAGCIALPGLAQAQRYEVRNYDGYCYMKQADAKRNGAIIGAVAGGVLGSQVSKNERGLGTVLGAVIGGAIGSNAGKNSVKCYNDEYYSYQGRYYDPPAGPAGYVPVFYEQRPPQRLYSHVYYDRDRHAGPPPYGYSDTWHGWRDDRGGWHDGQVPSGYWQDGNGNWHDNHGRNHNRHRR